VKFSTPGKQNHFHVHPRKSFVKERGETKKELAQRKGIEGHFFSQEGGEFPRREKNFRKGKRGGRGQKKREAQSLR